MHVSPVKIVCLLLVLLVGCSSPALTSKSSKKALLDELNARNEQLQDEVRDLQQHTAELSSQLEVLRGMPGDRLRHLVQVAKIELGRFTRPYDDNKDGLDDGINIYVVLRDRDNDTIKAAGTVEIELWDLAGATDKHRLGHWKFSLEELPRHWLSGLLADHYKFKLPWPAGNRPEHANLTVKCLYKDALSGATFEAQKMIEVAVGPRQ